MMEYWSVGVMEYSVVKTFETQTVIPLCPSLQYSSTPALQYSVIDYASNMKRILTS
jgi:hypothetical protein